MRLFADVRGFRLPATLAAALALSACASGLVEVADEDGTVFLVQNVVPNAVMDALFQGRVVRDQAGCLRLESPDPATVVWPKGFTLALQGGTLSVRDGSGRELGEIGGSFRLGGGEVVMHEGVPLSATDRERASRLCPGRFWIVGGVLGS